MKGRYWTTVLELVLENNVRSRTAAETANHSGARRGSALWSPTHGVSDPHMVSQAFQSMMSRSGVLLLLLLSVLLLPGSSHCCYQCFISAEDSSRLCSGFYLSRYGIRNMDACFRMLDVVFNNNHRVVAAGRVAKGHEQELKKILEAQILPLADELEYGQVEDSVYERKLQAAAERFITAASRVSRDSGCVPPCGFQTQGGWYDCSSCQYDSCQLPLDCPITDVNVTERQRSAMSCDVPFPLPVSVELVWRFAQGLRTRQLDRFEEVYAGADRVYSIPTTGPQHQGTVMCEIYSEHNSVVRLFFYLSVTSRAADRHQELQELFERSLLPGGRLPSVPDALRRHLPVPSVLLAACLTAVLLLLLLSLGALYWSVTAGETNRLWKD